MPEEKKKAPLINFYSDNPSFFVNMAHTFQLVVRLMLDKRVSPWIKLLPTGALVYLLSPLDMAIPVVDDLAVLWLLTSVFIELSPEEIVEEHRQKIVNTIQRQWKEPEDVQINQEDIQDAEFTETD